MTKRLRAVSRIAVTLFLVTPLSLLAGESRTIAPRAGEGPTAPGFRYQLHETIIPGDLPHVIHFLLTDERGKMVVGDTFTVKSRKQIVDPVFLLFRDDPTAYEAARDRARQIVVSFDGSERERLTFAELQQRATIPVADAHPFYANPKPRLRKSAAPNLSAELMARFRPTTFTESWTGCNDDDYCYAQWDYCNANCAPWDPYNPCEACDSNLEACTGGVKTAEWTDDTVTSTTTYSPTTYACYGGSILILSTQHHH
ncbi:MAG TPA: hypothetical protein VGJ82_14985, partial [Thermoanaerobaculia bacterium]